MGKTALVLAGGGFKGGAYEAGALKSLAAAGFVPDVLVGISAGAANASYVASLVAADAFTAPNVERLLKSTWTQNRPLRELLSLDSGEPEGEHSLQRILQKAGLDPLWSLLWPWPGLEAIRALRALVGGHFTSIFTHGMIHELLLARLDPPREVVRPVTLSVAATDLMASTRLAGHGFEEEHCHYETFYFDPRSVDDLPAQFEWLRAVVTASCSVPFIFPPVKLHPGKRDRAGLFMDGGLLPHAPLTHALSLHPDIDTLVAVMAVSPVSAAQQEPRNVLQMFGRYFTLVAGRYLMRDYMDLLATKRRRQALSEILERDAAGRIACSPFNQRLCRAAGFEGVDAFMAAPDVRLIAIAPTEPLAGGTFSPIKTPELLAHYCERGEQDAHDALLAARTPTC